MRIPRMKLFSTATVIEINGEERLFSKKHSVKKRNKENQKKFLKEQKAQPQAEAPTTAPKQVEAKPKVESPKAEAPKATQPKVEAPKPSNNNLPSVVKNAETKTTGVIKNSANKTNALTELGKKGKGMGKAGKIALGVAGAGVLGGAVYAKKVADKKNNK